MNTRYLVSEVVSAVNVALRSRFLTVFLKKTDFILELLDLLYVNGFIRGFSIRETNIIVYLKYRNSKPVISSLKIISKPGHRIF